MVWAQSVLVVIPSSLPGMVEQFSATQVMAASRNPSSFWGTIGINGSDPIVQAIYGAAICGEGIICTLGTRIASRPAMIAITTSNSISVKPCRTITVCLLANPPIFRFSLSRIWNHGL